MFLEYFRIRVSNMQIMCPITEPHPRLHTVAFQRIIEQRLVYDNGTCMIACARCFINILVNYMNFIK